MILQNIVFPKKDICSEARLYYREGIPSSDYIDGAMIFCNGQRVNFYTYYNSLSLIKWCEYTYVDNVKLNLFLKGQFIVNLVHITLKQNGDYDCKVIASNRVSSASKEEFSFSYDTENTDGIISFSLESQTDNSVLYGGYYSTDISNDLIRNVKIGIGICTYKREAYIKHNIGCLSEYIFNNPTSHMNGKVEVFISDNAQTLNPDDFDSSYVHIFKNKNTGGSGGYARDMIEVNNANENGAGFTHILLMDDDIVFDPESLFRTFSMLSLLKDEYVDSFVGGAMFKIEEPYIQHASGERWHGEKGDHVLYTYNFRRDMRNITDVICNENITDANYQGWWYCTIPMTICRKDNLCLPCFLKVDDIEYSLRNQKNLILLNGINVWHESFEPKYSAANEYYTFRNYLIASSIQDVGLKPKDIIKHMVNFHFRAYLVNFRYLEISLFFDAIDDFLKGVDYIKSIDLESNHQRVIKGAHKMVDVSELPLPFNKDLYDKTLSIQYPKSKIKKFFRRITLNGLLLPSNKVVATGVWGGNSAQLYRAKYAITYEPLSNKGFVLKRSLKKCISSYFRYWKVCRKIKRHYMQVKKEFHDRAKELESAEFWETKL